jgi:hypothetical protein
VAKESTYCVVTCNTENDTDNNDNNKEELITSTANFGNTVGCAVT